MAADPVPTPTHSRGDRRRARTRAAIVDAARRLFAERGAEAVAIQEITDAADVAKGSFYNHFDSREDLQHAVAAAALEALGAGLDRDVEQREADPARVVAHSLLSTLRTCLEDPALGAFLLRHPDVMEVGDAIGRRGRRDLLRGRRAGRFRFDDVGLVLTVLAGAGQSFLRARLAGDQPPAADVRFVALALRLLGVADDEADAVAAEAARARRGARS